MVPIAPDWLIWVQLMITTHFHLEQTVNNKPNGPKYTLIGPVDLNRVLLTWYLILFALRTHFASFPINLLHFPNQFLISHMQCCVNLPKTKIKIYQIFSDSFHLLDLILLKMISGNCGPMCCEIFLRAYGYGCFCAKKTGHKLHRTRLLGCNAG